MVILADAFFHKTLLNFNKNIKYKNEKKIKLKRGKGQGKSKIGGAAKKEQKAVEKSNFQLSLVQIQGLNTMLL